MRMPDMPHEYKNTISGLSPGDGCYGRRRQAARFGVMADRYGLDRFNLRTEIFAQRT